MFDIITPVLPAACCAVVRKDVNPYQVCFFNETSCAECSPRLPPHVRSCLSYILCRAPVVSEHCNWRCSRPSHLLRRTGDYNKNTPPKPSPPTSSLNFSLYHPSLFSPPLVTLLSLTGSQVGGVKGAALVYTRPRMRATHQLHGMMTRQTTLQPW